MKQIQQVIIIDAIRNVGGIVNQLPWAIALTNGHMQIGGGHRFHSYTLQAYTQESKNTPSNHTLKIFQTVDVASTRMENFATQIILHQTSNPTFGFIQAILFNLTWTCI